MGPISAGRDVEEMAAAIISTLSESNHPDVSNELSILELKNRCRLI